MFLTGHSGDVGSGSGVSVASDGQGFWAVPEGFGLFRAEFGREGHDLVIADPSGSVLRLSDYFASPTPGTLVTQDGAQLAGRVVERLAGPLLPGQYAQVGGGGVARCHRPGRGA